MIRSSRATATVVPGYSSRTSARSFRDRSIAWRRAGVDGPSSKADSTSPEATPAHAKASTAAVHFFAERRDKVSRSPTVLNEPDEKKIFGDRPPRLRDSKRGAVRTRRRHRLRTNAYFRRTSAPGRGKPPRRCPKKIFPRGQITPAGRAAERSKTCRTSGKPDAPRSFRTGSPRRPDRWRPGPSVSGACLSPEAARGNRRSGRDVQGFEETSGEPDDRARAGFEPGNPAVAGPRSSPPRRTSSLSNRWKSWQPRCSSAEPRGCESRRENRKERKRHEKSIDEARGARVRRPPRGGRSVRRDNHRDTHRDRERRGRQRAARRHGYGHESGPPGNAHGDDDRGRRVQHSAAAARQLPRGLRPRFLREGRPHRLGDLAGSDHEGQRHARPRARRRVRRGQRPTGRHRPDEHEHPAEPEGRPPEVRDGRSRQPLLPERRPRSARRGEPGR